MWIVYTIGATLAWSITNVLDSLLVKHFEKNPFIMMWFQAINSIAILLFIFLLFDIESSWKLPLILTGVIAYGGDLLFFYVADRIDISVINIAWAIVAMILTVAGFVWFAESWTAQQTIGAVFILSGVAFLSLFHHHFTLYHLAMLAGIAICLTPYNVIMKMSLLQQETVLSAFFWPLVGRESVGVLLPLMVTSNRKHIVRELCNPRIPFFLLNAVVIVFFFVAQYFIVQAYAVGQVSLVSVVSNTQPFFVIFFAWMFTWLIPRYAPREVLTLQTVTVKLISFFIVFAGLAFLAIST